MKNSLLHKTPERQLLIPAALNKNNFDLMRFLLAALVIYSHGFVLYYGTNVGKEPLNIFSNNQYDLGAVAVSVFFVISGFLIVKSFVNSVNASEYLAKRIFRIVPGFVVAFILSCVIAGYVSTMDSAHPLGNVPVFLSRLNLKRLVLQLVTFDAPRGASLFLTNRMPNRVNSPLWTIQLEVICYLLVLLFGLVSMIRKPRLALVIFSLSFITLVLQELSYISIDNNKSRIFLVYAAELPRLLAAFFGGACVYFYRHLIPRSRLLALLCIAAMVVASRWILIFRIVLPIAATYLSFYIAYHPKIRFHDFAKKGDFSYGVYLYGWPIQQIIIHFFYQYIGVYSLFFIALPLTCFAAYLSWHFVESPFMKKKKEINKIIARLRGKALHPETTPASSSKPGSVATNANEQL